MLCCSSYGRRKRRSETSRSDSHVLGEQMLASSNSYAACVVMLLDVLLNMESSYLFGILAGWSSQIFICAIRRTPPTLRARIRSLSSAAMYRPSMQCALSSRRQGRVQTSAEGRSTSSVGTTPVRRFTKSHLMSFKKAQLQEMLSAANLSTEGKKPELVESLLAHYPAASEVSANQPTPQLPLAHPEAKEHAMPPTQRAPIEAAVVQEPEQNSSGTHPEADPDSSPGENAERSQHRNATTAQEAPSVSATSSVSLHSPAVHTLIRRRPPLEAGQKRASSSIASQQAPEISEEASPECNLRTGMAVQWLGTSSGAPTQQRNVSSILLLQRRQVLMVDCGEGTVNQLASAGVDAALISGCASVYTRYTSIAQHCPNFWINLI